MTTGVSTGLHARGSPWLTSPLGGQLQEEAGMTTGVSTGVRARGGPRLTSPLGGRLQEGAGMATAVSTGLCARGGPPAYQDALVHVAVVHVQAHPDDAGVAHLLVVEGQ